MTQAPATRCIGAPISWLRLERYRLGELSGTERHGVALHLASCAACAACAARIDADQVVELPPLSAPRPARAGAGAAVPGARPRRPIGALVGALALAAAAVFGVGRAWRAVPGSVAGTGERSKGGAVAFTLVREDGARVEEAGGVFRDGDRFEAEVTCPPSMRGEFDLVVFDAEGPAFPIEPVRGLRCGNAVRLPGAFRLTGREAETVCLVWSEEGRVDRRALTRAVVLGGPRSLCAQLDPVASPP